MNGSRARRGRTRHDRASFARPILPTLLALLTISAARPLVAVEKSGDGTVAAFAASLTAVDPAERERAAVALGRLGPGGAPAVETLVATLADADAFVAGAAADTLARIGPASLPSLTRALADARPDVRRGAAIALGKLGAAARSAAPTLVRAASDPNEDVRWCAVNALGAVGAVGAADPGVLPVLRRALHDRDEDVRRGAALALERIDPAGWLRAPSWESTLATIETLVPLLMAELHVPGVSIALVKERKIGWAKAWGVADVGTGTPVTSGTLFEAASMTKPVFAVSVLKLTREGRLDLDRPLADDVEPPSVPSQEERRRITPRMVLSHTSGLPNWRKGGEERDGPLPVLFEPGSRFGYSGEAIYQLQRVVEQVTGEPLEAFARRTLFAPLGMEATSYVWRSDLDARLATGHAADGSSLARTRYRHANAAYSLVTTASDYARLLAALLDPGGTAPLGLSRASVAALFRHEVRADAREPIERPGRARGREVFWGLGWGVNTTSSGDVVYHSGSNSTGFRGYAQLSPSRGTGIVILANGVSGGELWTRLVAAIGDL